MRKNFTELQEETEKTSDILRASLVAHTVKNPPAMRETWIPSLDWEDTLEEEMATHSSVLSWRIPWTEESRGLQSMVSQRIRTERLSTAQRLGSF